MQVTWLSLMVVAVSGCTDLVTVEIGADRVTPIAIERDVPLGSTDLTGCPSVTLPFTWPDARDSRASITPSNEGCEVTITASSAAIVDRATMETQAQAIDAFDVTALVGIDLELIELALTDESGGSVGTALRGATVSIDGQLVFDDVDVGTQSPRPRGSLPETTVAAFREALAEPQDVRADLEIRLTFADPDVIPALLGVRIALQPILRVDVLRAAL